MHPATIGSFQILRELGKGGMGEVFLARDTRLDRQVAVKALPEHLAQDPDRLARFQREAKLLASLNHPGIGAIYGLEEMQGRQYLILEYVEGETLAERLARGSIPVDEAMMIARQIAEAVEAAHEKGVIHRDLKPGNVMVTPEGAVKVLDFGLARTEEHASTASSAQLMADSPTVTTPARGHSPTMPGVIMGSAGYMSPEQARGKPVDKRSDVFSFGCILYEMLTGAQPFGGETATDSIGAILHREPDWALVPPQTPRRVRELLASCLAKDRRNRLHDIGDARLAIDLAGRDGPDSAAPRSGRSRLAVVGACAGVGLVCAAAGWLLRPASSGSADQPIIRFTIPAPPGITVNGEYVNSIISPDGRSIAFIAEEAGSISRLWVRELDALTSRVLEGTEGATLPFWSPDSRSIAFFANGALFRIAARGGPIQRLADAPGGRGGDWSETGVLLFAPSSNGPLQLVSQSGGATRAVTELAAGNHETGHRFPQFLPGGRKFLYASLSLARHAEGWKENTRLGSLDSKDSTDVCTADSRATYAPGGWLLVERSGTLYATKFDSSTGATSGEEIDTGVRPNGQNNYAGSFSVSCSRTGVISCPIDGRGKVNCAELNAEGQIVRTLTDKPGSFEYVRASPSGDFAAAVCSPVKNSNELRLFDLTRGVSSRPVDDQLVNDFCWSADGKWLYYSADRTSRDIFRCSVPGAGKPELVLESGNLWASPRCVSADGRLVIFTKLDPKSGRDLWMYDTAGKSARPLAAEPCNEFSAALSPDEHLMAIVTDESGKPELYVQTFPEPRERIRVTLAGLAVVNAGSPSDATLRWSRDGSSILFLDADAREVLSAAITDKPALHAAKPQKVIHIPANVSWVDVAPDGKSVFGTVPAEGQAPCSISVTLNWRPEKGSAAKGSND